MPQPSVLSLYELCSWRMFLEHWCLSTTEVSVSLFCAWDFSLPSEKMAAFQEVQIGRVLTLLQSTLNKWGCSQWVKVPQAQRNYQVCSHTVGLQWDWAPGTHRGTLLVNTFFIDFSPFAVSLFHFCFLGSPPNSWPASTYLFQTNTQW